MAARPRNPWYQNPTAVGILLVLMVILVLLVWVVGVGAAYWESAGI